MDVNSHVKSLLDAIEHGLYEKKDLLSYGILCAIAGESLFLLGTPGTAKSEISRRLKLIFKDATSFEYLMSRFSTPDEIFGPVSIQKLKDNDLYERRIKGYLPASDVVFLDEIWKAGPAIQNALLTVLNEKIFRNGCENIAIPMKLLIAASNELPMPGSGLDAIWDRFIFRAISESIKDDTNFCNLLRITRAESPHVDESLLITGEIFRDWQEQIKDVKFTKPILLYIIKLRKQLATSTDNLPAIYVSDRRWAKIGKILRTSAFLNGRNTVDWSDVLLMRHCLWNQTDDMAFIYNTMVNMFAPMQFHQLDTIESELEVISKKRVFRPTNGVGEDDFNHTRSVLQEIVKRLSDASVEIFSSINSKYVDRTNIFVSDADWELIDSAVSDIRTRVTQIEKKITHEQSRFK